jgi:hypothetical protein
LIFSLQANPERNHHGLYQKTPQNQNQQAQAQEAHEAEPPQEASPL